MEPHDDQEHLRPLSSLTTEELRARLRAAARAAAAQPTDPNKQTLEDYLNDQESSDATNEDSGCGIDEESNEDPSDEAGSWQHG